MSMKNSYRPENNFWNNIPDDCKKAISELKRMKVFKLCGWDYEETFADVWWLVLHEVDMYDEGEFCFEANRSYNHESEPDAMNHKQAKRADEWLIRWLPLFNKYKQDQYLSEYWHQVHCGWNEWDYSYGGQID